MSTPLPRVGEMPYEGVEKLVRQTGVDAPILERMLKIAAVSMNPGTEAEGQNAARALELLLRKYSIERAAVLALAGEGDVMREAGRFYVEMPYKRRVHAHFQLAHGVCALFNTAWYHTCGGGRDVFFVFVGSAALAHSAARLFAELYVKSTELSKCVTHKKAFLAGMTDGFSELSRNVRAQRLKYYERIREEAAVRERAAHTTVEVARVAVKREADLARTVKREEVEALLCEESLSEAEEGAHEEVGDSDAEEDEVEEVEQPPRPLVDLTGPDEDAVAVMQNERDDAVKSAAMAAIVYDKKRKRALMGYKDCESEHYRAGKRIASDLPIAASIGGA